MAIEDDLESIVEERLSAADAMVTDAALGDERIAKTSATEAFALLEQLDKRRERRSGVRTAKLRFGG